MRSNNSSSARRPSREVQPLMALPPVKSGGNSRATTSPVDEMSESGDDFLFNFHNRFSGAHVVDSGSKSTASLPAVPTQRTLASSGVVHNSHSPLQDPRLASLPDVSIRNLRPNTKPQPVLSLSQDAFGSRSMRSNARDSSPKAAKQVPVEATLNGNRGAHDVCSPSPSVTPTSALSVVSATPTLSDVGRIAAAEQFSNPLTSPQLLGRKSSMFEAFEWEHSDATRSSKSRDHVTLKYPPPAAIRQTEGAPAKTNALPAYLPVGESESMDDRWSYSMFDVAEDEQDQEATHSDDVSFSEGIASSRESDETTQDDEDSTPLGQKQNGGVYLGAGNGSCPSLTPLSRTVPSPLEKLSIILGRDSARGFEMQKVTTPLSLQGDWSAHASQTAHTVADDISVLTSGSGQHWERQPYEGDARSRSEDRSSSAHSTVYQLPRWRGNARALYNNSELWRGNELNTQSKSVLSEAGSQNVGDHNRLPLSDRNQYTFTQSMGTGVTANVWLAIHKETGEAVAVKEVGYAKPQGTDGPSLRRVSKRPPKTSVEYEVRILKDLDHPHIEHFYGFVDDEDNCKLFIFVELADLGPLARLNRDYVSNRLYTIPALVYFFRQVASALEYLHARGIVHHDIKPENILLTADYRILLGDFGSAEITQDGITVSGTYIGTPSYMAPELVNRPSGHTGAVNGHALDMWAFGVSLECMLSGKHMFRTAADIRNYTGNVPYTPNCPDRLYELLRMLLSSDPRQRPSARVTGMILDEIHMSFGHDMYDPSSGASPLLEGEARPPMLHAYDNASDYNDHDDIARYCT